MRTPCSVQVTAEVRHHHRTAHGAVGTKCAIHDQVMAEQIILPNARRISAGHQTSGLLKGWIRPIEAGSAYKQHELKQIGEHTSHKKLVNKTVVWCLLIQKATCRLSQSTQTTSSSQQIQGPHSKLCIRQNDIPSERHTDASLQASNITSYPLTLF